MKITALNFCRLRRRTAAFSLVEATVGLGILSTLVGAIMSGFTSGLYSMQLARENLRATQIMLERMETIRLYSWDQVNRPGFISTNFSAFYDPNSVNKGVTYTGTMTLSDATIGSSYSNDMKCVTVRLDWKTGNLNRNREFTSYISRRGLQNYIY